MPNFSTNDVILVRCPYTDLSTAKVRPAVVIATFAGSVDHIICRIGGPHHRAANKPPDTFGCRRVHPIGLE